MSKKPTGASKFLLLGLCAVISLALYSYSKANQQTVYLNTVSGPIVNPLMGWAPWAMIEKSNQPHTLVYADLTWRDFEPVEGMYDFNTFEKEQQLTRWRQKGQRVVFRFVVDQPGSEQHLDIPDWLFEKIGGSGEYYDNEYGKGFSPDYAHPLFLEYHRKAISALGKRYGGDGFFAFIELGSLGHWGEWHTHPELTTLPSEEIRDVYVSHYIEAFPGTHLLMRRPFTIAQALELGLYNDMTADPTETNRWLAWIENGEDDSAENVYALSAMPEGWRVGPIGGEQAGGWSDEQIYGAGLGQTLQLLQRSHTTFIGPGSPYRVKYGSPLQEGIDRVLATIGYRIDVDHVRLPRWVHYGNSINIECTFSNKGIAPMYYNWPTYLYLFDEDDHVIASYKQQMDLRKILPGEFYEVAFHLPVDNLKNGIYSIGIAIIDPITGRPAVKFANVNIRNDLIQYLGSFEVRRLLTPE